MTPEIQEAVSTLPDKALLTIEEVRIFFSISKMSVYRWYESGKLKGCNVAGVLRIYRKSVITLLENGNGQSRKEETPEEIEEKLTPKPEASNPASIKPRRSSGWVKNW